MKVYVVFDFPNIKDVESSEADYIISVLEEALNSMRINDGFVGYVDEAVNN